MTNFSFFADFVGKCGKNNDMIFLVIIRRVIIADPTLDLIEHGKKEFLIQRFVVKKLTTKEGILA
jgi:hypothetical protein